MLGNEFANLIKDGLKPVVLFNKRIEDQEGYLEKGMRGRIIGIEKEDNDTFSFKVDFQEFEDFNKQFESSNYYDEKGNPTLTAREAGYYKPQDTVWADIGYEVPWEVEEDYRLKLYNKYKASPEGKTYVQWLEDYVAKSMGYFI